jgi:hypothetical protein
VRNLALGLVTNFSDLIVDTASAVKVCPINSDGPITDPCKKLALKMLMPFREELRLYPTYRLRKEDAEAFSGVVLEVLAPHDLMYVRGELNTDYGNASITVQTGTILASLVASQRMLWDIRQHNEPVALYIHRIYDMFCFDPGDPEIEEITKQFLKENPIDGSLVSNLISRLTEEFISEIDKIPEDQNYFARHIFKTGFVTYPGIGCQLQILSGELAR